MVNPTTTNVLLQVPLHGAEVDTWDVPVNSDFTSLDGFLGGVQTINAAGLSPITLTAPAGAVTPAGGPSQSQNAALKFTGALTGNVPVTLPLPGQMVVHNLTTGPFVLSFRAIGSGEVIAIDQGAVQRIYNDGTNVYFVDLPQVGTYLDSCEATVPAWIAACTKPPYLNCDGSAFSGATFPYLAQKLGGTTLPDLRGVGRYTLNQGTGRITTAGSGIDGDTRFSRGGAQNVSLSLAQLPTAITVAGNITVATNPGEVFPATSGANWGGPQNAASTPAAFQATIVNAPVLNRNTLSGPNTLTSNNTFGASHTNMPPGTISGITLIRAG